MARASTLGGVSFDSLSYGLQAGYVHNWLVAGPNAAPVASQDELQIVRSQCARERGMHPAPSEGARFEFDGTKLRWEYVRCQDDHFIDLTAFHDTCHYLRAWVYARLVSPAAAQLRLTLTTNGTAKVWLNGRKVHNHEALVDRRPQSVSIPAAFDEGQNEILVGLETVAVRECPWTMALKVEPTGSVFVLLPTSVEAVERRQTLEEMFDSAYLDRDVFVWDDEILVKLPDEMPVPATAVVRLQTPSGKIYFESERLQPGGPNDALLGRPYAVPEGRYEAFLLPPLEDYYVRNMRIHRKIGLWAVRSRYTEAPATYDERRVQALEDAAQRDDGVASEIARMALGRWSDVRKNVLIEAAHSVSARREGSVCDLVALLGVLHRYGTDPSFPAMLREPLERCVLSFRYWVDEPGSDGMSFWSESRQILFHVSEILAGQLYPDRIFTNSGQTGRWHCENGDRRALGWLSKRGTGGMREWDSNSSFAEDVLALSHLVDLSTNQRIYDLAAVVMDKFLFSMAVNSYRGIFGSTHGQTSTPMIKSGRLEATAGIGRLLWGLGVFNNHTPATVALACATDYELPPHIAGVAMDLPQEMWNRERHAGELDDADGAWEVNKVTYKTPDYMLCSAQNYRPGERGGDEHIWQATLGPDAVVFANHPPCFSEDDSHQPNFWRGNDVLPRVAQWKDVLIATYKLPDGNWLGFTHAYFPLHAFDQHTLRQHAGGPTWAFARKGNGYLALTASQGLELITRGDNAYRELRSYGRHAIWLCHMGRVALDGSFSDFQEKVLALNVTFGDLSARSATLRGDSVSFGWHGPLLLNGAEQPITGFKHYDNPYCVAELPAQRMEVRIADQVLKLSFADHGS